MAPTPETALRRARGPGRPPRNEPVSLPPSKKLKYIPGGPGGGGRYLDQDTGMETPVGGTGPGGYNYTGSRGRVGRMNAKKAGIAPTDGTPTVASRPTRVRTDRDRQRDRERRQRERESRQGAVSHGPRSSSAAAAAAAVAQNDGYKPREERGWEEFHPDLDLDAEFMVFPSEEVDGLVTPAGTNQNTPRFNNHHSMNEDGANGAVDVALLGLQRSPSLLQEASLRLEGDVQMPLGANGTPLTPKRRPGRPPRRADHMLTGLGSPPAPRIVPLPSQNPRERLNLPKPIYRQIETFAAYEQDESVGVNFVDRTMSRAGYQESDIFIPTKTFIRNTEGTMEEDLDVTMASKSEGENAEVNLRVEYDMDEQDERWLEAHNLLRKDEGVDAIKPALFEITMTQIEKEWHSLEKRIPKPNPKPPQTHRPRSSSAAAVNGEVGGQGEEQDSKCAICDDGDCENTNAIVFCDGCDLAVHQECYGVPFIPEGQWLCRKCQLIGRSAPSCIFCPNVDGAFKQTNNMRWSHLLCAIWIPEVSLGNTTFMEPVMDVEKVQRQRWKLTCYICQQRMGACIQCGNKACYQAFHVTCARRARLYLKMKSSHSTGIQDASVLKAFCHKHVPTEWRRENDVEYAFREAQHFYRHEMRGRRWADSQQAALAQAPAQSQLGEDDQEGGAGTKRKRGQHQKNVWRLPSGAPIVPFLVFQAVETSLLKFTLRKRKEFVAEACKYWTLKREARRGAALLKRLQLQMETFSSMEITRRNFVGMGAAGGPRLQRRIEFAEALERDMEHIRQSVQAVNEREEVKRKDAGHLETFIENIYFPIPKLLRPALDHAITLDSKHLFTDGFERITKKQQERYYTSVTEFSTDIAAVLSAVVGVSVTDARVADQDGFVDPTIVHSSLTAEQKEEKKLAKRILKALQPLLEEATRKEAELIKNPAEAITMTEFVKRSTQSPPDVIEKTTEPLDTTVKDEDPPNLVQNDMDVDAVPPATNGTAPLAEPETAPPENTEKYSLPKVNGIHHSHDDYDETTDEAVIRLQLGQTVETIAIPNDSSEQQLDTIMAGGDPENGETPVPALSTSDSTHPSTTATHATDPDSNPHADVDSTPLEPTKYVTNLSHGGIPWYAAGFSPSGTTVHEDEEMTRPQRAESRMSSDLSSLDENEVEVPEELADAADMDADKQREAERAVERKKRREKERRRKRNRGW